MRRPSPAFVLALVALFVALGGPAAAQRAADRISGKRLTNNSVTSAKIRNGTLGVRDLSRAARNTLQTPADNSVDSEALADDAVQDEDIAASAVQADEIADNAVQDEDIAVNAVGADELQDGGVNSADIADGGLRAADVAPYYGQAELTFPAVPARSCVQQSASLPASANVADDVVAVSPPANWPANLTVNTVLGPTDGRWTVTVCNPTDNAVAAPGAVNFRYIVFNI